MQNRALVAGLLGQDGVKARPGPAEVSQPEAAQGDQVIAVNAVSPGKIVVEELQIRQGDGEVIHSHFIVIMLFPIGDEPVESAGGASLPAERFLSPVVSCSRISREMAIFYHCAEQNTG